MSFAHKEGILSVAGVGEINSKKISVTVDVIYPFLQKFWKRSH